MRATQTKETLYVQAMFKGNGVLLNRLQLMSFLDPEKRSDRWAECSGGSRHPKQPTTAWRQALDS